MQFVQVFARLGINVFNSEIRAVVAMIDKSGSGFVSLDEFLNTMRPDMKVDYYISTK